VGAALQDAAMTNLEGPPKGPQDARRGRGGAPFGRRSSQEILVGQRTDDVVRRLGASVASARRRRGWTQAALARRVGISRSALSRVEVGLGHGVPLSTWLALAAELGLAPRFDLGHDPREEPADAGHLALQELLLRLGRAAGRARTFELPTGLHPSGRGEPGGWIDVCLRDDRLRCLIVAEAWNVIGDIGAGARSFERKLVAVGELGVFIGGDEPYSVHGAWVVRATARNRALVARYPEVFATRFPGSSHAWAEAIVRGTRPPADPGLVWTDLDATRVFAWRRGAPVT
jgi:transcriptional regulator with XRE-family HTH domain